MVQWAKRCWAPRRDVTVCQDVVRAPIHQGMGRGPETCVGSISPNAFHPILKSHDFGSDTSGSPGEIGDHLTRIGVDQPENAFAEE